MCDSLATICEWPKDFTFGGHLQTCQSHHAALTEIRQILSGRPPIELGIEVASGIPLRWLEKKCERHFELYLADIIASAAQDVDHPGERRDYWHALEQNPGKPLDPAWPFVWRYMKLLEFVAARCAIWLLRNIAASTRNPPLAARDVTEISTLITGSFAAPDLALRFLDLLGESVRMGMRFTETLSAGAWQAGGQTKIYRVITRSGLFPTRERIAERERKRHEEAFADAVVRKLRNRDTANPEADAAIEPPTDLLQYGKRCAEIIGEVKRIWHRSIDGGRTIAEIEHDNPSYQVWGLVRSLPPEDQETFRHPNQWGPRTGYAQKLLAKGYGRSEATIHDYAKDYRAWLRKIKS